MRRSAPDAGVQLLDTDPTDPWPDDSAAEALEATTKVGSSPWEPGDNSLSDEVIPAYGPRQAVRRQGGRSPLFTVEHGGAAFGAHCGARRFDRGRRCHTSSAARC